MIGGEAASVGEAMWASWAEAVAEEAVTPMVSKARNALAPMMAITNATYRIACLFNGLSLPAWLAQRASGSTGQPALPLGQPW